MLVCAQSWFLVKNFALVYTLELTFPRRSPTTHSFSSECCFVLRAVFGRRESSAPGKNRPSVNSEWNYDLYLALFFFAAISHKGKKTEIGVRSCCEDVVFSDGLQYNG